MKIKIGVPSKGRLRKDVLKVFRKNKYNLISERGERDYFAKIKNKANIEIIYLHAREIIERLSDNSLDVGFSGYDLLKEALVNIQKKISVPFLSMPKEVYLNTKKKFKKNSTIGLLSTEATLDTKIYHKYFEKNYNFSRMIFQKKDKYNHYYNNK